MYCHGKSTKKSPCTNNDKPTMMGLLDGLHGVVALSLHRLDVLQMELGLCPYNDNLGF